jgi:dTDP-4-dehydrorhamnose reductase
MAWLITGGSGQLGLAMQKELSLRSIDFLAPNSTELDITNSLAVDRLVQLLKPKVIINAAAWTDVDGAESNKSETYSVNTVGSQNLVCAASNIGAFFVQISTDYVFSGESKKPWNENETHNPQSIYGLTKSESEIFVRTSLPTSSYVIRTAWLYSSEGTNFAKTMTYLALNSFDQIKVVNDQIGQPTFAGDLAKQIIDLVLSDAPAGIYHGTNSGQATWFEFAKEIFKLASADISRVIPVSTSEFPKIAKRPAYSVLSHKAWKHTTIPVMRNWKIALAEAMPAIISSIGEMEN